MHLFFILGPIEDFMGHPFAISFASSFINGDTSCLSGGKVDVSALTLLYRRFEADEMSTSDSIDSLHSLQWLPTFITGEICDLFSSVCSVFQSLLRLVANIRSPSTITIQSVWSHLKNSSKLIGWILQHRNLICLYKNVTIWFKSNCDIFK